MCSGGGRGGRQVALGGKDSFGDCFTLQSCSDSNLNCQFAKFLTAEAQEHLECLCSEVGGFHHQLAAICQLHGCNAGVDLHSLRDGYCLQTRPRDQAKLKLPASITHCMCHPLHVSPIACHSLQVSPTACVTHCMPLTACVTHCKYHPLHVAPIACVTHCMSLTASITHCMCHPLHVTHCMCHPVHVTHCMSPNSCVTHCMCHPLCLLQPRFKNGDSITAESLQLRSPTARATRRDDH